MENRNFQPFHKIFKENLSDDLPAALSAITGEDYTKAEPLPTEITKTLSRKPDFLYRFLSLGTETILHIEVQRKIDYQMHTRMLLYAALLHEKHKLPIKQLVLYIGDENGIMPVSIEMPDFTYRYQLVDFRMVPYRMLLGFSNPSVALFAILSDFGGERPANVITDIVRKLKETAADDNDLSLFAYQLEILSDLRN